VDSFQQGEEMAMQFIEYQYWHSAGDVMSFVYDRPCDDSTVLHFHGFFELIYVISGEVDLSVDGITTTLSDGEFGLLLPYQTHMLHNDVQTRVWVCSFPDQYAQEFADLIENEAGTSPKFTCDAAVTTLTENYVMENTFCTTHLKMHEWGPPPTLEEKTSNMPLAQRTQHIMAVKACLNAICVNYLRQATLVKRERLDKNLAYKLLNYISEHFREGLTLRRAAEELGYNYTYLSRCQQRIFGCNFSQFVNQCRAHYARQMLLEKPTTGLSEIAMLSGFGSIRNFNIVFKKIYGKTPSEHRKL